MVMIGVDQEAEARALGQFGDVAGPYTPSTFEGLGTAIAEAPFRLASKIPMAVGMGAAGLTWLADKEAGYSMFRANENLYGRAVDHWTPDAATVGAGSQVVGSLAEIIPALFTGAAALPILAGTATAATGRQLAQEGVDGSTAGLVAGIQGAATAAGFAAPAAIGRTLAQRVASGAAINTAVGAAGDAASAAALESGGYDRQAEQFNPANLTNRGVDLLIGAAFGGAAHFRARGDFDRQMTPADRDAILAVANNDHLVNRTGPGRPATPVDAGKQSRNMDEAITQLLETGKVDASRLTESDITFAKDDATDRSLDRAFVEEELRANGSLHDVPDLPPDPTRDLFDDVVPPGVGGSETPALAASRLPESPEVSDALAAIDADPELAGFRIADEDGNEMSIGDVINTAVKESNESEQLSVGFKAAASCFLRSIQ